MQDLMVRVGWLDVATRAAVTAFFVQATALDRTTGWRGPSA
jgi:hypothetical protein